MTDSKTLLASSDSTSEKDELKDALNRLEESEKRFHQIFDQQFQCMLILDTESPPVF